MNGNIVGGSIYGNNEASNIGGSIGGYYGSDPVTGVTSYAQTVGDGTTTVFSIVHNLGTADNESQAYNPISGASISPSVYSSVRNGPNQTTFTFTTAPAAGAARIVILRGYT